MMPTAKVAAIAIISAAVATAVRLSARTTSRAAIRPSTPKSRPASGESAVIRTTIEPGVRLANPSMRTKSAA